jgi:hypothetical protein
MTPETRSNLKITVALCNMLSALRAAIDEATEVRNMRLMSELIQLDHHVRAKRDKLIGLLAADGLDSEEYLDHDTYGWYLLRTAEASEPVLRKVTREEKRP